MANDNYGRGLFPDKILRVNAYRANTAADIYLGMLVAMDANGEVGPAGINTAGLVPVLGVAVGFQDEEAGAPLETDPFLDVSDIAAGRIFDVLVADNPFQQYIVQEDTGGSALAQADAGTVATMIYMTGSGNTNSGWANQELDRSTAVTTNSGQIRLLAPVRVTNSDGTQNVPGNYCKWRVTLLNHQLNITQQIIAI